MVIDLSQIPDGETFELFCRDLLEEIGCRIIQNPSRGPDGKKDLLIEIQNINRIGRIENVRYLVQCKHNAKSGKSVYEHDIGDFRSACLRCNVEGYFLITSTIPSTTVSENLRAVDKEGKFRTYTWDRMQIETYLLKIQKPFDLLAKYGMLKQTHAMLNHHEIVLQDFQPLSEIMEDETLVDLKFDLESFLDKTSIYKDNFTRYLDFNAILCFIDNDRILGLTMVGNKIKNLPSSIGQISELEYLHILSDNLTSLPISLSNLHKLDVLDVSKCNLSVIPEWIEILLNYSLRNLLIEFNPISKVPDLKESLSNLETLFISSDQMDIIEIWAPYLTHCFNLCIVDLDTDDIRYEEFTKKMDSQQFSKIRKMQE